MIPRNKIGLLGPAMTYSDLASETEEIKKILGKGKIEKIYYPDIQKIIAAVAQGKIQKGLVPIENSIHGTIRETEDALFRNNVEILFAYGLPIHHGLFVKHGTEFKKIKKIVSHEQALEQCRNFLEKNYPEAEKIATSSTIAAIEYMLKSPEKDIATIAPRELAHRKDLKMRKENIEDEKTNTTIFLLIQKKSKKKSSQQTLIQSEKNKNRSRRTSIAFWFKKDSPGSLYEVLREFAKAKINLTKIESRPATKRLGEYIFFLDFEGDEEGKKERKVLKNIKKYIAGIKSFGSYEIVGG